MVKALGARAGVAGLLLSGAVIAAPVGADTLREALLSAYTGNPTLATARAQQRATDENVPIARAAQLPSLSGTASFTDLLANAGNSTLQGPKRVLDTSATLGVPLYAGGAIRNSIRSAQTRVAAGKDDLRSSESSVFSQTVAAYMDVLLNEAVVGLNHNNVSVLEVNLRATKDRFEIGDLTRTDVAQSQARLELARGQTQAAEANLTSARERYIQVVGKAPVALEPPPALPGLPGSVDEAAQYALDHNPDLLAAALRSKAATYDTATAGAGRLPKVSVFSTVDRTDYLGTLGGTLASKLQQSTTSAQAGVRATIPIFQGGLPAAQRRQAQMREDAAMETRIGTERAIIAGVRSAYAQWQAAIAITGSTQSAVDAARLSLEGVRAENTVGNRTILDILNAEQELVSAQVQLATARRNAYVAGFNLLSAMGKAEARDLGLDGGVLYDPDLNYERVKGRIWDWSSDPAPTASATSTVDTRPQDGSVTTK